MKKIFFFIFLMMSMHVYSQVEKHNVIKVYTTLTPNAGSFVAISEKAAGRLLKTGKVYSADRISVFASSFETENNVRDKHFAEYIGGGESLPHPRIDLLKLEASDNVGKANIVINGVTKEIPIKYVEKEQFIEAEFNLDASDFNLKEASFLGVKVSNLIKVTAKYYWESK